MNRNRRQTADRSKRSRQGGFVLISATLLLVVLLGFAALGIDVGMLYSARAAQQRAADSAALAGAFSFVTNPFAPQPETARDHALSTAIANEVFGEPIEPEQVTVTVDVSNARVHVSLRRSEGLYFAKVLGRDEAGITVEAAAEASQTAGGSYCTKPFFLPNTILGDEDLSPCEACDEGAEGQVLIGEDGMTAYAGEIINSKRIIRIKPSNPQNAL
ncbi:MAG: hypothetical protein JSU96_07700, partial [Acidobacteriota bacterium]